MIACAAHWPVFAEELEQRGHDIDELESHGLLTRCDADKTVAVLWNGLLQPWRLTLLCAY